MAYRVPDTQVWREHEDGVFASRASDLPFRPAAYVDGALTGMRFHQGPYRTPWPASVAAGTTMTAMRTPARPSFQKLFLTGLLTLLPIWLTWVVVKFVFVLLSDTSRPVI